MKLNYFKSFLLTASIAWAVSGELRAQDGTWTNLSGGAWSTSGNWAGGTIADGIGITAFFNSLDLTSPIALTLGGGQEIGNLNFGDTVPSNQSWSLSGGALILDVLSGTPTVTVGNLGTGTATISSVVIGDEGLLKNGTGTLVLSGSNTYTGATTIRGGQLVLDNANGGSLSSTSLVFGNSAVVGPLGSGSGSGIFTYKGAGSTSSNLGRLAINYGQSRIVVDSGTSGADTVRFDSGVTRTQDGTLQVDLRSSRGGLDGQLLITDPATEINGAFGVITDGILAGFMVVRDSGGAGFVTADFVSGSTYSIERYTNYSGKTISGGGLANSFFGSAIDYKIEAQPTPLTFTNGGGTFSSLVIDTSTASGSLNLGTSLTIGGNQAGIILSGANNYEISGGGDLISTTAAMQLFAFGGGTLTVSADLNILRARITGDGTVVLSGNNTLGSPGTNASFSIFGGGTLSISTAANLGDATKSVYFDSGTLHTTQSGALTLSGLMGTGTNGATFDVTQGSGELFLTGIISQAGPLTKTGAGTLELSGANTYTGTTEVRAGTLRYGASNVIAAGQVWVNGGTLDLNGFTDTVGSVVLSSGSIIGSGTLTGTAYTVESGSVSAILAGSGAVTKSTGGSVTFSAANTYTGSTLVTGGTLVISGTGSIAGSASTVSSGATLNVNGIAGSVAVNAGGTLMGIGTVGATTIAGHHTPGNSPGIQNFASNLTYTNGSSVTWELIGNTDADRGTNFDGINVAGDLTITGTSTVNLVFNLGGSSVVWANSFWDTDQSWLFYDVVGTSSGAFALGSISMDSLGQTLGAGRGIFSIGYSGNDVSILYTAIPEPSTTLLLTGALTALMIFRRRRAV